MAVFSYKVPRPGGTRPMTLNLDDVIWPETLPDKPGRRMAEEREERLERANRPETLDPVRDNWRKVYNLPQDVDLALALIAVAIDVKNTYVYRNMANGFEPWGDPETRKEAARHFVDKYRTRHSPSKSDGIRVARLGGPWAARAPEGVTWGVIWRAGHADTPYVLEMPQEPDPRLMALPVYTPEWG